MSRLLSSADIVKILLKFGFQLVSQRGSHQKYQKEDPLAFATNQRHIVFEVILVIPGPIPGPTLSRTRTNLKKRKI